MCDSNLFLYPLLLVFLSLFACATEPQNKIFNNEPEKLIVHPDGTKQFRDRKLPDKDVIIYDDGLGGERAAVKVLDPLHSDYFRDSIVVERMEVQVPDDVDQE